MRGFFCVLACVWSFTVEWEVMCIYKALQGTDAQSTDDPTNNSLETPLTRNQFDKLYEVTNLSWRNETVCLCDSSLKTV